MKKPSVWQKILLIMLVTFLSFVPLFVPLQAADTAKTDTKEEEKIGTNLPDFSRCQGAYLYNFENDAVLVEDGMDARIYPASTVKLMTGIVAFEELGNRLEEEVTITAEMLNGVSGNNIALKRGEKVKVLDLLAALLVNSANDAAQALAVTALGSVDAFVSRMNKRAVELGAKSTYYTNVTGMHSDNMITTVGDVAIIAKYAYSIDGFIDLTSQAKYVMSGGQSGSNYRNIFNRNAQISQYYETRYYYGNALGMNAGFTNQAGYSIVSVARKDNLTYLCIVMNAEDDKENIYSYTYAREMLEWAFMHYSQIVVLKQGERLAEVPVALSTVVDYVTLAAADEVSKYLPTSTDVSKVQISCITNSPNLTAPIYEGEIYGTVTVSLDGEILGTTNLVATMDVERSEFLYTLEKIEEFTSGMFFRATVVFIVIFSVGYVLMEAHKRKPKRRYR